MHDLSSGIGRVAGKAGLDRYHVKNMILSPRQWAACQLPLRLRWRLVKFTEGNLEKVPKSSRGVYSFVLQPSIAEHPRCAYLLYVGQTEQQNFRKRYYQYLQERRLGVARSRRPHVADMLEKWDGYLWFCYASIEQKRLIESVEKILLTAYLPPTNKDFPGEISRARRVVLGT